MSDLAPPSSSRPHASPRLAKWLLLAALLVIAAGMYVSIMYKIIKFGP